MKRPAYFVDVPHDHPDAAVIALCNEANALHLSTQRRDALADLRGTAGPTHRATVTAAVMEWHRINARITLTPASTPEGIRAKAEVLATVVALEEPMVASIVGDILGRNVGARTTKGRARFRRDWRDETIREAGR